MRGLLCELRGSYERIVIDSPPTGLVTDALVLAPLVDAALQVILAGSTSYRLVCHGRDQVRSVGGRHLGAVLNASRVVGRGYGYYGQARGYPRRGARGDDPGPSTAGGAPPGETRG
jgi:Mrp family chromosome partitioning ATPase